MPWFFCHCNLRTPTASDGPAALVMGLLPRKTSQTAPSGPRLAPRSASGPPRRHRSPRIPQSRNPSLSHHPCPVVPAGVRPLGRRLPRPVPPGTSPRVFERSRRCRQGMLRRLARLPAMHVPRPAPPTRVRAESETSTPGTCGSRVGALGLLAHWWWRSGRPAHRDGSVGRRLAPRGAPWAGTRAGRGAPGRGHREPGMSDRGSGAGRPVGYPHAARGAVHPRTGRAGPRSTASRNRASRAPPPRAPSALRPALPPSYPRPATAVPRD